VSKKYKGKNKSALIAIKKGLKEAQRGFGLAANAEKNSHHRHII